MNHLLADCCRDVRHGVRGLLRTRVFTLTSILTLTVSIGGPAAVFTVADGVLFKSLGYTDPEQLFVAHEVLPAPGRAVPQVPVNALHFEEWRRSTRSFAEMALIAPMSTTLRVGHGEPRRVGAARVSPSVFRMLGLRVQRGRLFSDDEQMAGTENVVVIADGLWRSQFGADPTIVGRTIDVDAVQHTVIGVLAEEADFPNTGALYETRFDVDEAEVFKPFVARPAERTPTAFNHAAILRLKKGTSALNATRDVNAVQTELGKALPGTASLRAELVPLRDQLTKRSRAGLELLLFSGGFVFLTGCINAANLFLTRGLARRREMAIRHATGATTSRLTRQLVAESLLVALAGGVLATGLARVSTPLILALAPIDIPRLDQVAFDARAMVFTALASVIGGLFVGLVTSWRLTVFSAPEMLKSGAAAVSSGTRTSRFVHSVLVGSEVATATLSVFVAALLVSSLAALLRVDRGFESDHVSGATFSLPRTRYNLDDATRMLERLRDGASAIPGIVSVGLSDRLPLSGEGGNRPIAVEGAALREFERPIVSLHLADDGFFRTMGIPLLAGRLATDADRRRAGVAVVSAAAAKSMWPHQTPVGKRFRLADNAPWIEVVGIVGDVRGVQLELRPRADVYLPYWSTFVGQASLSVRTSGDHATVMQELRALLRSVDPLLAVPRFSTMDALLAESIAPRRFQMILSLLFAGAAVLLAIVGVFGTTSYTTAMRTSEIGLRVALGARHEAVRRMIALQGLTPVGVGVASGLGLSLLMGSVLRGVLFGVSSTNVPTLLATALSVVGVGALATFIPTRRALRVNPIVAVRGA